MELLNGQELQNGKYRILKVLGVGYISITYLAVQVNLRRKVVIKELFIKELCVRDEGTSAVRAYLKDSREIFNRIRMSFVNEARSLAELNHRNVVSVFDMFNENYTEYYVMEYFGCGSLEDKVRMGALPEKDALKYIRQIASALNYMHSRRILFLDIRPAKIMLAEDGNAVLANPNYEECFHGLYEYEMSLEPDLPFYDICKYHPLEISEPGHVYFPVTDIYSLGATLYKLVTGQTPPNAYAVFEEGLPPMPETISDAVRTAVESAMQPRRKYRPQSINEFIALIDGVSAAANHHDDGSFLYERRTEETQLNQEVQYESLWSHVFGGIRTRGGTDCNVRKADEMENTVFLLHETDNEDTFIDIK